MPTVFVKEITVFFNTVDDSVKTVIIYKIAHRREAYR